MANTTLPPFHPDHLHNQPQYQQLYKYQLEHQDRAAALGQASYLPPITPPRQSHKAKMASESGSASASASISPDAVRTCFCGNMIDHGEGIYCSAACARSDAFSTLCNRPNPPSLGSSIALGLPSTSTSSSTTSSVADCDESINSAVNTTAGGAAGGDWESHYGSMCRADLRREERKEERRRRRAEGSTASSATSVSRGTMMSTASTSANRVPDLVGGHGYNHSHSRNASVASSSSRTSYSSNGGLSRNPSTASSVSSSRRGYGGIHVDTAIMEDDDEAEWLVPADHANIHGGDVFDNGLPRPYGIHMPPTIRMPVPSIRAPHGHGLQPIHQRRRPSHSSSKSASASRKKLETFGMGQDMRDVLEEIIQMEKEFIIDESSDDASASASASTSNKSSTSAGVFTAVFDRPPRTPSPGMEHKRQSLAPGAPAREHRKSMSMSVRPPPPMPDLANQQRRPQRPPSAFTYGHSASLSESHTALYLATASPESATRQSASPPKLKARNSMTFTPEAAGPIIPPFLGESISIGPSLGMGISPNMTPSRRRPNGSPGAHHPAMSGWKFPSANMNANGNGNGTGHSDTATPTKLSIDTQNLSLGQVQLRTPTRSRSRSHGQPQIGPGEARPQLLWPPNPTFAPSQFPTSPAHAHSHGQRARRVSPPDSGLRLGVLLGLGEEGMDMDMGMDVDDASTAHGHIGSAFEYGFGHGHADESGSYLFTPADHETGYQEDAIRFD